MKKNEFKDLIKECIQEVISEEKDAFWGAQHPIVQKYHETELPELLDGAERHMDTKSEAGLLVLAEFLMYLKKNGHTITKNGSDINEMFTESKQRLSEDMDMTEKEEWIIVGVLEKEILEKNKAEQYTDLDDKIVVSILKKLKIRPTEDTIEHFQDVADRMINRGHYWQ